AWVVFALTFGLLLSDYMSRQVLNAVFPLLKAQWSLSDAQLGSLSGVVALMVGLLTFPLSLLADRWGRVRSLVLMAALWSLATLGCAISASYGQMFAARFCMGVGEAAYGSVGVAVILSVFPAHMRATLTGAFTSGGAFGSVLGIALGGVVAVHFGWRWSFGAMAAFGLMLVLVYPLVVTERRLMLGSPSATQDHLRRLSPAPQFKTLLPGLFSVPSVVCAYIGSGLQLFIIGSLLAWMPSFLNRYYHMAPDKAGPAAAVFVLITGIGMIACGALTDKLSRNFAVRKWLMAILYCLGSFVLLMTAFQLQPGTLQLVLLGLGMFAVVGTIGPAGAMVANLTHPRIHATAFATLTLVNNLLGLAPGPFVTGMIADRLGLLGALQIVPTVSLLAVAAFIVGRRHYAQDLRRVTLPKS
ncbi:MAG TPA: MFS transporter, partial [Burkholderiales bacterium]|nr:MFS transporter [Burkholderiales bacterium]